MRWLIAWPSSCSPRWRPGCWCPGGALPPRSRRPAIRPAASTCCGSAAASPATPTRQNDGQFLAGGRALATPFGTFFTPNITPDPETGIGGWSTGEFVRAVADGISPDGHAYFPAFPYPSYARMTEQDLVDLKAYLDGVAPVANRSGTTTSPSRSASARCSTAGACCSSTTAAFAPDPAQPESWNRGAYIVNGPGHCGECHTPRNALGAREHDRFLAGTRDGPDGKPVPNITPGEDGIGDWSKGDIAFALQTGLLPDGDALGGAMAEVVDDATSHLTADDRNAIAEYLLSLPPLESAPAPAGEQPPSE